MSFDSYSGTFDEELPPNFWYNYKQYMHQEATTDRDRFESYLEEPTFDFPQAPPTEPNFIDIQEGDDKNLCFEEWSPGRTHFWSTWVANELEVTPGKEEHDGLMPFGNNLIWMNHRLKKGLVEDKMYIAYSVNKQKVTDIITATCVFVQKGGVYSVLGMTKSKKYNQSYLGSAYELQKYIAHVVHEKLDPSSMGLLFRPNSTMLGIMQRKMTAMCIGSDWDMIWVLEHEGNHGLCDMSPSILQDNDGGGIILRQDEKSKIPTPFWEAPAIYCNPDGPNNPQIPLVFIAMEELHCYAMRIVC